MDLLPGAICYSISFLDNISEMLDSLNWNVITMQMYQMMSTLLSFLLGKYTSHVIVTDLYISGDC